jgi:hypothetical protein
MRLGFVATTNPFGAGKWTKGHSQTLRGKDVAIFSDIGDADGKGEKHTAQRIAAITGIAKSIKRVILPDGFHDVSDYIASLPPKEAPRIIRELIEETPALDTSEAPAADQSKSLIESLDSGLTPIYLPGCGRLLSKFASDLAASLKDHGFYQRGGHVFIVNERRDGFERVTPQMFRTLAEKHVVCLKGRRDGEKVRYSPESMSEDNARGVLESLQFRESLPKVLRVHTARIPILRRPGKVELLPEGYDRESFTLTLPTCKYDTELSLDEGRAVIDDLLREFLFSDEGRSKAVAISAMVGIYCVGLLDYHFQRPTFFYDANAEGAGKTLLAKCAVSPTHGIVRIDGAIRENAETDKELGAAVIEGRSYIIFDNCKGRINSSHLEAFASSAIYSGRILGESRSFHGENLLTVFITGNGATTTPDMRRRSLQVNLFTDVERAEDRIFNQTLNDAVLLNLRPLILAALWSFVREWDKVGRPRASRSHSAFPEWADTIGGIVEHARYACPLLTPEISAAIDPVGADMRQLVELLRNDTERVKFDRILEVAFEHGLFEQIIGTDSSEVEQKQKTRFGKLLIPYSERVFIIEGNPNRFSIIGKGHQRCFQVVPATA